MNLVLDQRYRIVRLLGEGGMGAVYLGEHVGLKKQVAVKVLHANLPNREEAIQRFQREAQVAATLRHPNIIEVFDVGISAGGDPYLVMEYLEGESLRDLMARQQRLDLTAACAVVEPVLLALQAAHRKGIVHRDLKPDNVFLASEPEQPQLIKLIDFGISKLADADPDRLRTQTGMILGTPNYMSPEQARNSADVDHRTDLYAVGTILYELVTGALPFAGDSFAEFFARLLTEEPRPPRTVFPEVPTEVEPLLQKAIRKDPTERFQSAEEMLEALRALPASARKTEGLALLAGSQRTFAVGDLGSSAPSPSTSGTGARSRLLESPSPSASGTGARSRLLESAPAAPAEAGVVARPWWQRPVVVAGLVLAMVLLAVGAGFLLGRKEQGPQPAMPPAPPVAAPAPAPEPIRAQENAPQPPAPASETEELDEIPRLRVPAKRAAKPRSATAARAKPEPKPEPEPVNTETEGPGLGGKLRALGGDLIDKARAQVKRIPGVRSSK